MPLQNPRRLEGDVAQVARMQRNIVAMAQHLVAQEIALGVSAVFAFGAFEGDFGGFVAAMSRRRSMQEETVGVTELKITDDAVKGTHGTRKMMILALV